MSGTKFKLAVIAAGAAIALTGTVAQASHFRGGALVASVSASGLVTVNATSFWRPAAAQGVNVAGASQVGGIVFDTSDTRFTKSSQVFTTQMSGAGVLALSATDCCRVVGPINSASTTWTLNSSIFWNGTTANTPILFNFSNVQPEVVRGVAYNGNLTAIAGAGVTLSYDQVLNAPISAQPAGFTIDPVTGALNIPVAFTTVANYPDNTAGNVGADVAFSGNIKASDGSSVEFEWLFDGVAASAAVNQAPTVNDQIINALVGASVGTTVTATDDGLPLSPGALSWTDVGLLSPQGTCTNTPTFNTGTQAFAWDTTGCTAGAYVYQVQTSDGQKSDFGTVTVNLSNATNGVPEPETVYLMGAALVGLGLFSRRRKS